MRRRTRSPQPVPKLRAEIAPQAKTGGHLEVMLTNEPAFPDQTFRVVRLEFETASGSSYELYARNLLLSSTPHTERIPLAWQ